MVRTTSSHYEVVTDRIPGLIFSERVDAVDHARDVANGSGRVVIVDHVWRTWTNDLRRDFSCYVNPSGAVDEPDDEPCRHGIDRTSFCAVCTYEHAE